MHVLDRSGHQPLSSPEPSAPMTPFLVTPMKHTHPLFIWLGAAVVAIVVNLLLNSGRSLESVPASEPLGIGPSPVDQGPRIAELEARIRELEERPLAPTPGIQREAVPSAEMLATNAEALAIQEEMKAFLTALKASGDQLPDQLLTSVQEAVELVDEQRAAARAEERSLERAARVKERVDELASDLTLDSTQVATVRSLLELQEDKRAELREARGDRGREGKDALRDLKRETREAIEGALTPWQLEIYQASRDDDRGGERRTRDGGSGGGGGGGGDGGGGGGRRRNRTNRDG